MSRNNHKLSRRELEALKLTAAGKTSEQIGQTLAIAKRTADEHLSMAVRKLDAENPAQAVAIAVRDGLI
jgi:DNA-binding CsgD family transcriptional regulator